MNAKQIVSLVASHKGQNLRASWERQAKTFKDCALNIRKSTSCIVRAGIDYANLASVKSEIELGTRDAVEPLPWGTWQEFPFIIAHKGQEYVRLYPASGFAADVKPQVDWTIDGRPASYREVEPYLLASEKPNPLEPAAKCFTLKADSILSIG
jgi:hypothetical protein